jgi:hypothetical protein
MRDKEYTIDIADNTKAYVHFTMTQGIVAEFVVKLLILFQREWHEIIRYDSGHSCPHKDILNVNGEILRKVWYDFLDNGQALTMAITDIKDNHEFYKERYEQWLKGK